MSAPGWSTEPQSRHWPGLGSPPDSSGEPDLGRWVHLGSGRLRARRARPGWHAYRPAPTMAVPSWAAEMTLTIERPLGPSSGRQSAEPRALLLLRSASAVGTVMLAVADAMKGVERLAGIGGRELKLHLLPSRPEPDLEPLVPAIAFRHLRWASQRGIAPRPRRRSSAGLAPTWEAGAGAVVTCRGPAGLSAQAVVSLHGSGDPRLLRPPPGGAMVLRAWRPGRAKDPWRPGPGPGFGRTGLLWGTPRPPALPGAALARPGRARNPRARWALTSGLILASANAAGLGREAGRAAKSIRAAGWDASVLTGPVALEVAHAGDPCQPVPRLAARWVTDDELIGMLTACLTAAVPA
jgi:hypothetical protein